MKTIKSIIIGALVALVGSSAWAAYDKTADLTMCVGDVLEIYEEHGNYYNLTAASDRETVVTAARAAESVKAGKFFTLTAVGAGTAKVTLTAKRSGATTTNKMVFNITVNAARTVMVNGTAEVAGWANDAEPGNASWTSSAAPSGAVSVSLTQQSTSAMAATLTGKTVGDAQVTFSNVKTGTNGNVGFKYIYAVKVEPAAPKAYDYMGYTITAFGAEQVAVSGDDLVLRFTESGTMNVPVDLLADILVVGGGGSGEASRSSSSSDYQGNGGGGAEAVYREDEPLSAADYAIVIGEGGPSATAPAYPSNFKSGTMGSPSSFADVTAKGGSAGTGGAKGSSSSGTGGSELLCAITGTSVVYGQNGSAGNAVNKQTRGTDGAANTGAGGGGGRGNDSGAGGSGVVIVRFTGVVKERTPIEVPTAAQGLVYGWTNQVGVAEGAGYVLTGVAATNAVGAYTAFATPDDDHCWADKSRVTKEIAWSIDYRPATVTVIDTNKVTGAAEPVYRTRNEGFIAEDPTVLTWVAWRTNTSETVGTYDVVVGGEEIQGGYRIAYVGGKLEIREAPPPTFDITIAKLDCVTDVRTNGVSVVGTLALPAETAEVALELVSTNTIPVFKLSRDGGVTWTVTNRTPVVAVAANDTLTFMSEEAKMDDPTVTEAEAKVAIKDAIDPGDAHDAAVAKVEAVAGTGENQVPAKELAKWITDNAVSSEGLSKSDYVVASVNLGTSKPIVEENAERGVKGNTEIAFTEVEAATSDGFTFDFELKIDGTAESLELAQEYVAGCIRTTGDLGTGFEVIGDPDRVTIDPETGKVTIKPDPTKPAEFFKIVIPKDPGAK